MKPSKKDLDYLRKERRKSIDYKKGFLEGYKKGHQDTIRIYKEGEKNMKPIREAINKLRTLR